MYTSLSQSSWTILEILLSDKQTKPMSSFEIRKVLPEKTTLAQYRYAIRRLENAGLIKRCGVLGNMNVKAYYVADEIDFDDYSDDLTDAIKEYLCVAG